MWNRKPTHNRRAFTLIEMMVVLLIIAVGAAMVIAGASGGSGAAGSAAARTLSSDLQYAQSLAVTHQTPVTVAFDVGGESYTVSSAGGIMTNPVNQKPYVVRVGRQSPYPGVAIVSAFGASRSVTFSRTGEPDRGGTVVLSQDALQWQVNVSPVTGKVSVVSP